MDGFIESPPARESACRDPNAPNCSGTTDVMGYHDGREIPNYWRYARDFVLQDHLFEPNASWSLTAASLHGLGVVGVVQALGDPISCINELQYPDYPPDFQPATTAASIRLGRPDYAWTDLTYLLHAHHVSWAYYVMAGTEPDCANDADICASVPQNAQTPGIWNVLPMLRYGQAGRRAGQHSRSARFLRRRAQRRRCPASCGSAPRTPYSEHPPALVSRWPSLRYRA